MEQFSSTLISLIKRKQLKDVICENSYNNAEIYDSLMVVRVVSIMPERWIMSIVAAIMRSMN